MANALDKGEKISRCVFCFVISCLSSLMHHMSCWLVFLLLINKLKLWYATTSFFAFHYHCHHLACLHHLGSPFSQIATHDSLLSNPTASDSQISSLSLWPKFLVASYLQFFALSLWFLVAAISWNLQLQMLELVCNLNLALMRFVLLGAWKDTITTITLGTTLEEFLDSCDFAVLCSFCSFFVFLTPPKWA
jgi:hypothetical protein